MHACATDESCRNALKSDFFLAKVVVLRFMWNALWLAE